MSCQNRTKGLYETVPAATPDNHKGTRPLDKCFILGIPDDILVEILRVASHVTPDRKTPGHELYETAARLALVCRRFNRIATPLLYWQININCQVDSITNWSLLTAAAAKKLHRSLRRQPNLWSYCRRLTIHAAGAEHAEPGSNISYIANDFVTWLTAARYLSISYLSPRNEGAWSLVRTALEHMTNLVALDLQCDGDENIDIGEVVEAFGDRQHPYLRTLELTGIGKESISNVAWTKLKVRPHHLILHRPSLPRNSTGFLIKKNNFTTIGQRRDHALHQTPDLRLPPLLGRPRGVGTMARKAGGIRLSVWIPT